MLCLEAITDGQTLELSIDFDGINGVEELPSDFIETSLVKVGSEFLY
jgi:hypothetical protein